MIIPVLYIPSFYGDIRLERIDGKSTRVIVAQATPVEQKALRELGEHAIKKKWFTGADDDLIRQVDIREGSFTLSAEIKKVQGKLTKLLKPGREVVTVVKFANGKMEELLTSEVKQTSAAAPSGAPTPSPSLIEQATSTTQRVAEAAASVAKPYRGCPAPDFVAAELRANRVLEAFLDDEQQEDFRKHNRFVTVGAATGHRLLVTSRHAKDTLAQYHRSLFDLDDDTPLCVHDWDVAPAEEMLALHLLAQVPEHELYMRQLEAEAV